ncbi:mechanosensitive ion channel family protein [Carnobacterium gallinarum]|uniref:mechanosensitive ion channel family protein n=1 Tax=Carnobacterium gallinarum TaxID=2749 RepID=UPI0005580A56|nr:mechanosensitive ion channel family protein [Carnobacterium gallinarum]
MDSSSTMDSSVTTDVVDKVAKSTNYFLNYWNSINWSDVIATLISKGIQLFFLTVILLIITKIGKLSIEKSFDNYKKKKQVSQNRLDTLYTLSLNIFHYIMIFFYAYGVLSILGVPVATLLAGAGVVGIAIGLGAQGFVSDIVTGFFIILEKQLDVGDYVKLDPIEGTVIAVGIRTTQVKSLNGTLNFIPNRNITIVSNLSRGNMRALIDIRLLPNADINQVTAIIQQVNDTLVPEYPEIVQGPTMMGLTDLGNGMLAFRVVIFTLNGDQFRVQNEFLRHYVAALTDAGIEIPASPLSLMK